MFKIIDSSEVISNDKAREKYKGYMVLLIREDRTSGRVYAIADGDDTGEIADLQGEFHKKNIRTLQVNGLVDNLDTLYVRECELL